MSPGPACSLSPLSGVPVDPQGFASAGKGRTPPMAFPPQGPWPVFHVSLGCSPASSSPQMRRSKVLPPWRSSPTSPDDSSPLSMAVPAATLPSAHSRDPSPGWFPPLQRLLLLRASGGSSLTLLSASVVWAAVPSSCSPSRHTSSESSQLNATLCPGPPK